MNFNRKTLEKLSTPLSIIIILWIDLLFLLTPYWQLTFLAAFIGGLICSEMKWGAISGMVGILSAWGVSMGIENATNNTMVLLDQIGDLIMGDVGLSGMFILIILLVGAVIGVLGGSIGSGMRILIDSYRNKDPN